MNTDVNFHPTLDLLERFASGSLSAGMSVAISAHIERCEACRESSSEMEARASVAWLPKEDAGVAAKRDFSGMIDAIVAQAQQSGEGRPPDRLEEIHMQDRSVELPRVLAKIAVEGLIWKKLAGGINQASVKLDDETQCEFIYMKAGSQVPQHRHLGNEITLVLDGSFHDEMGTYYPADFVLRNPSHSHNPTSEEGCLCFAVLDQPFVFTRGIARLMNPFMRRRFRRATAGR